MATRSVLGVVAVCSLVVLAGCNLPAADGLLETRTPYDVPPRTGTPATEEGGPGGPSGQTDRPHWVQSDGTLDPSRVVRIHVANLANETVTVFDWRSREFENGTFHSRVTTIREYGREGRAHVVRTEVEPDRSGPGTFRRTRSEFWGNETLGVVAVAESGATAVQYRPGAPGDTVRTKYRRLFQLLQVLDPPVVDNRSVGEHTLYVALTIVPDPPDAVVAEDLVNPRNLSLVVRVRDDGVVRSYRLKYTATLAAGSKNGTGTGAGTGTGNPPANRTITVVEERSFGAIGGTGAQPPEWVPAAVAEVCGGDPDPCRRGEGWPVSNDSVVPV